MSKITFYRGMSINTRSTQIDWLINEYKIQDEVEVVKLDMKDAEHKDDVKNPHPFGKVPALKLEDGTVLWESAVIDMYLTRRYNPLGLSENQLWEAESWVTWMNASWGPGVVMERSRESTIASLSVLEDILTKRDYLCSFNQFSVADLAVTYLIAAVERFVPLPDLPTKFPKLKAYLDKNNAREAYKAVLAEMATA